MNAFSIYFFIVLMINVVLQRNTESWKPILKLGAVIGLFCTLLAIVFSYLYTSEKDKFIVLTFISLYFIAIVAAIISRFILRVLDTIKIMLNR